ncbi:MAG: type II secretion system protein [Phycisphaerales bacterium JB063]
MRCRGLNLIEVLVAVCLIAVLAVVSLPMLTRASGEARSTACRANLMTLGQVLEQYQQTHGQLPTLMNRDDRSLDVPTLDTFLTLDTAQTSALHCPGDNTGVFERSGTSYGWFALWNQRAPRQPDNTSWPRTPILSDKAPFHDDPSRPYNALLPSDTSDAPPFVVMPYAMPY